MTEQEPISPASSATPVRDIVIETAADLFDVLRGADFLARFAAMRQIALDPEGALSLGTFHGQDVVDELVHQFYQQTTVTYLKGILVALGAFRNDQRAVDVVKKAFIVSKNASIVDMAGRLLVQMEGAREALPDMRGMLAQNESEMHARAAALVLSAHSQPCRSSAERIRLILISPPELPVEPPLSVADLEHRAEWVQELCGPYALEARVNLESLGEPAIALLADVWPILDTETWAWLLTWATTAAPEIIEPRVEQVLAGGEPRADTPVLLTAIEAVGTLGAKGAPLVHYLSRYIVPEKDATLRVAAIRSGAQATTEAWRDMALNDAVPSVRHLAIVRYGLQAGMSALDDLMLWLQSDEWQARSLAADCLAGLDPDTVIPLMRPLVHHDNIAVRAAAANVLISFGDDEWLEDELLS